MTENTGKNTGIENLIPWKAGDPSPNPSGRPLGQKNYATLYKEALIKLAKLNNKEPDELEIEMISKGILSARAGDYRFYKDVLDRLGMVVNPETSNKTLILVVSGESAKRYDIPHGNSETSSH